MRQITLEEFGRLIAASSVEVVYLHWGANHYKNFNPNYHVNIQGDGTIWVQEDFDKKLSHTWQRNTGALGITICCCAFATSNNLGDATLIEKYDEDYMNQADVKMAHEPPTEIQIETMAQVMAITAKVKEWPMTTERFMTHAEIADVDDYGPATTCERWDLAILHNGDAWMSGGDILRGKAAYYMQQPG